MKKSELKEIIIECVKNHISENLIRINNIKVGTKKFSEPSDAVKFITRYKIDVHSEIAYDQFRVGRVYSTVGEFLKLYKKNMFESIKKSNNGFKLYTVKVKHDDGTTNIVTAASSEKSAKEIVMNAEGCPECAIISIKEKIK